MKPVRLVEVGTPETLLARLPFVRLALAEQHGAAAADDEAFARVERFLRDSLGRPETLLLFADAPTGEAVGVLVAAGRPDPMLGRTGPFLYLLFVRSDARREGIADALLARAVAVFRARGASRIAVEVPYQDDALLSMGERRGWVREREWMERSL